MFAIFKILVGVIFFVFPFEYGITLFNVVLCVIGLYLITTGLANFIGSLSESLSSSRHPQTRP